MSSSENESPKLKEENNRLNAASSMLMLRNFAKAKQKHARLRRGRGKARRKNATTERRKTERRDKQKVQAKVDMETEDQAKLRPGKNCGRSGTRTRLTREGKISSHGGRRFASRTRRKAEMEELKGKECSKIEGVQTDG